MPCSGGKPNTEFQTLCAIDPATSQPSASAIFFQPFRIGPNRGLARTMD
jgi:hypothetical protein